jgi:hypothetical protein
MRLPAIGPAALVAAAAVAIGGCGDVAFSSGNDPTAAPSLAPQPSPAASAYWLRATTVQAIPPVDSFGIPPLVVVTGDGSYVTVGPTDAMYPGPALPNLQGRPIGDEGRAQILAEAERLGLLTGQTDFMSDTSLPGAVRGRLEMTVDGKRMTLTGDPEAFVECVTTPCDAPPGTPAAFADFWAKLQDPAAWLGEAVGAETPYVADAYALLIGPPPPPEASVPAHVLDWPLDIGIGTFGTAVANGSRRCGTVTGADAETLRPALEQATQASQWVQDADTSATFGIVARPFVPGEDPCAEAFGPA